MQHTVQLRLEQVRTALARVTVKARVRFKTGRPIGLVVGVADMLMR